MAERKRIFLIRHGTPESRDEEKRYIGWTDLPLSRQGRKEARQLGHCFAQRLPDAPFRILTSPLARCRSTAMEICQGLSEEGGSPPTPVVVEALHEIDLGTWEGKTRQEIMEAFPEDYAERGAHLGRFRTPGGKSFQEAGERFQKAMEEILFHEHEEGREKNDLKQPQPEGRRASCTEATDCILVIAHAGVLRAYLSLLLGRDMDRLLELPMPYASVTELELCEEKLPRTDGAAEGKTKMLLTENSDPTKTWRTRVYVRPDDIGVRPEELLDEAEIRRLYRKYETPERVIRHMRKVAEVAGQWMTGELNRGRVTKACLLHDLCRTVPEHARVTAEVLRKEGYPQIAALVAVHHDARYTEAEAEEPLTEAELLFYADKRVQEDRIVTVEARFQESRKKCRSPEAMAHHAAMLEKTRKIEEKLQRLRERKSEKPRG